MLIPFSAPKLPELDALSDGQHRDVISIYVSSGESGRLTKRVRVMLYVAIGLMLVGLTFGGSLRAILCSAAILLIPLAIVIYRKSAERVLRKIILDLPE